MSDGYVTLFESIGEQHALQGIDSAVNIAFASGCAFKREDRTQLRKQI